MRTIPLLSLLSLLAVVAVIGCATTKESYVSASVVRGGFIDATLSVPGGDFQFLFANTDDCARVLQLEAPVTYSRRGPYGEAVAPDGTFCDPLGIGSLRRWRSRFPRQEGAMVQTSPARWSIIHTDPQVHILRGRFGVSSYLGLANTFDSVVVVPNDGGTCTGVAKSGDAILTFRTNGSRVLDLGPCAVQAIAAPPPGS